MTLEHARQYLIARTRIMNKRYRDQYFKWSTADLIAVQIVLRETATAPTDNPDTKEQPPCQDL